jgi:choice-of-anchor C domain-containing protein
MNIRIKFFYVVFFTITIALTFLFIHNKLYANELVVNGNFELPVVGGSFRTFYGGSSFEGWSVGGYSIDLNHTHNLAASGQQSIDLSGYGSGNISQNISTIPGKKYLLKFAMSGNPVGGPKIKYMSIWWGNNIVTTLSFDTTGKSTTNMGWKYYTYLLETTTYSNVIKFADVTANNYSYGSMLDDVSITEMVDLNTALDNNLLALSTSVNANWFGESTTAYFGSSASQSGLIADGQSSWLESVVTGPGIVSFHWKVSSESGFDYLRFSLDGAEQDKISGEVNWQLKTFTIPGGNHTIRWTYEKDSSISRGSDCGWVDKLEYVGRRDVSAVLPLLLEE